jgi:hypothetical protein
VPVLVAARERILDREIYNGTREARLPAPPAADTDRAQPASA